MNETTRASVNAKPRVVNVRRDEYDVYIGRANGRYKLASSKWANPFPIEIYGVNNSQYRNRDQSVAAYREWIIQQPDLMAALPELRGKRLACWCAPLPCHGDVLVELVAAL